MLGTSAQGITLMEAWFRMGALLDKVSSCVGNVCTGHHADGGVV